MSEGITYNDDLLLKQEDQDKAKRSHPLVFFALNHPELRAIFVPVNDKASQFKDSSRMLGLTAVALVAASLITAAAQPYYHENPYKYWIAGLAAVAGIAGAGIGVFGIFFSSAKRDWLERRMITERLRQLHFQMLVAWAPLIVEAAQSDAAMQKFLHERAKKLGQIDTNYVNNHVAMFPTIIEDEAGKKCWMVEPIGDPKTLTGDAAAQLFEALRFLRIEHQQRYANSKKSDNDNRFWSSPVRQVKVMSAAALVLVTALIGFDVLMLLGVTFGLPSDWIVALHVATVIAAIVALAQRTVEEGLRSHGEVERYRHYSAAIAQAELRFEAATDVAGKLAALRDLELAAYEEMVSFLKSNKEARFVM